MENNINNQEDLNEIILKISSSKESGYSKKVAGAIGWRLRETGLCSLRAVKMVSCNTAIKAIAIVNKKVSQAGAKFAINACFASTEKENKEDSTAIAIELFDVSEYKLPNEFLEYKVSGEENDDENIVTKLSGAIAPVIRGGKGISLRCIGPAAVYRALKACIVTKGYVYSNGIELICVPIWASIAGQNGKDISLIQIDVYRKI